MSQMEWTCPREWTRIRTIDAHAEGEPLRVIVEGFPGPEGDTVLERRQFAIEHLDGLRRTLMWEPRGHADMYGCLVMPAVTPRADFSVLFLHNAGFSTMCGHGIIGVAAVAAASGLGRTEGNWRHLVIDTPAGTVRATARLEGSRVRGVRFVNVPSFADELEACVEVPGLGVVTYDLAFGGAYYAYVDASALGLPLVCERVSDLIAAGRAIKTAVSGSRTIVHPTDPELGFLYGTIFTGPAEAEGCHSRHVCVFADGEVDRSPTGTGVSGRLAILHARGALAPDEEIRVESILGSRFSGRIRQVSSLGDLATVSLEIEGRAFVTGCHEFVLDPDDPLAEGFLVR